MTIDLNNLENIIFYISNYENLEANKKQKGEVFTPYVIIEKMLSTLEETYYNIHKTNIYENKTLKWFDNSSGIGNIMFVIYYKLNNALKNKIKNEYKRKKHILENMIYMSEINPKNTEQCKLIFDNNNEFKLNLYTEDSLKLDLKGMDIIIGNPPYQKTNTKTNNARGGTNNNLYLDFANESLNQLNDNGFLVYIHPQNWRKIDNPTLKLFLDYNIKYIGLNYGGKLFKNVSVKTDYYVLQKTKTIEKTKIECYNKNKVILSGRGDICKMVFGMKIMTITRQFI
jgi:hypothetical protein